MIKVGVCGAGGRMGSNIIQVLKENKNCKITALIEKKGHPLIGEKIENVVVVDDLKKVIGDIDVLIDFTNPSTSLKNVEICAKFKKKIVIGTTGFKENEIKKIKNYSKKIGIVLAPNMSVGVNLLIDVVEKVAGILKDYDIEIVEYHHNQKKDAPSGTALKLAEAAARGAGLDLKKALITGRHGFVGERSKKEIGVLAVRGGDIVGEHYVMFCAKGERVEIVHKASSRRTFAEGAVKAAIFLAKKKKGFYNMQDVLGLKKK